MGQKVGHCRPLPQVADGLWTCLVGQGSEPSNNHPVGVVLSPGVRPLSQSVIQG